MINIMMDVRDHIGNEEHNMTPFFDRTLIVDARDALVGQTERQND
jgi:hypothetical protein